MGAALQSLRVHVARPVSGARVPGPAFIAESCKGDPVRYRCPILANSGCCQCIRYSVSWVLSRGLDPVMLRCPSRSGFRPAMAAAACQRVVQCMLVCDALALSSGTRCFMRACRVPLFPTVRSEIPPISVRRGNGHSGTSTGHGDCIIRVHVPVRSGQNVEGRGHGRETVLP